MLDNSERKRAGKAKIHGVVREDNGRNTSIDALDHAALRLGGVIGEVRLSKLGDDHRDEAADETRDEHKDITEEVIGAEGSMWEDPESTAAMLHKTLCSNGIELDKYTDRTTSAKSRKSPMVWPNACVLGEDDHSTWESCEHWSGEWAEEMMVDTEKEPDTGGVCHAPDGRHKESFGLAVDELDLKEKAL